MAEHDGSRQHNHWMLGNGPAATDQKGTEIPVVTEWQDLGIHVGAGLGHLQIKPPMKRISASDQGFLEENYLKMTEANISAHIFG